MNIFVLKNGQQLGPLTLSELNRMRASGQIQNTDMAWHDEIPDWTPVSQIVGLDPLPSTPSMPPVFGAPVAPPVPSQTPVAARWATALVVFVISFGVFFCVLFVLACAIGGGIVGAQASLAQHAQGYEQGKQIGEEAGRAFGEKYIPLIAGGSLLASFILSGLLAWGLSCSRIFPWCRPT